jgi:hypothetical protein
MRPRSGASGETIASILHLRSTTGGAFRKPPFPAIANSRDNFESSLPKGVRTPSLLETHVQPAVHVANQFGWAIPGRAPRIVVNMQRACEPIAPEWFNHLRAAGLQGAQRCRRE